MTFFFFKWEKKSVEGKPSKMAISITFITTVNMSEFVKKYIKFNERANGILQSY